METFLTVRSWIRFLTFLKQDEFTGTGVERPIVRSCALIEDGWSKDSPLTVELVVNCGAIAACSKPMMRLLRTRE